MDDNVGLVSAIQWKSAISVYINIYIYTHTYIYRSRLFLDPSSHPSRLSQSVELGSLLYKRHHYIDNKVNQSVIVKKKKEGLSSRLYLEIPKIRDIWVVLFNLEDNNLQKILS